MTRLTLTRRTVIAALAALGLAPRAALAGRAEADALAAKLTGGAKAQEGKVRLKIPQVAENGNSVAFTVAVDHPMTPSSWVKAIHVIADDNPRPEIASFHFTPQGRAEVSSRLRLARSQTVRAVAILSDGTAWETRQEVKVTIGGCGA